MHSNLIQNKATCLSFHSNYLRLPNSIYRIYDRFLTITCIQNFSVDNIKQFSCKFTKYGEMVSFKREIDYANTRQPQSLQFRHQNFWQTHIKTPKLRHDKTIPTTNIKTEKSSKYSKKVSPSFPKFIPVQNQNPKSQNFYFQHNQSPDKNSVNRILN